MGTTAPVEAAILRAKSRAAERPGERAKKRPAEAGRFRAT